MEHKVGGMLPFAPILGDKRCPPEWTIPENQDNRSDCTPIEDQEAWQACAAVAVSYGLESLTWRETHIRTQYDWKAMYTRAKQIDGFPAQDGTMFHHALQAARELGYCKANIGEYISDSDLIKAYIHSNCGVCLAYGIDDGWYKTDIGWITDGTRKLGGHGVWGCWYTNEGIGHQGSWGTKNGVNGFMRMTWSKHRLQLMYAYVMHKESIV